MTGIGPYSAELAEALAKRGHAVRVVTTFPFYPQWRPEVPSGTLLFRTEQRDGVQVTRCRVYTPHNPQPVRRLLHELSWTMAAGLMSMRLMAWADVWLAVTPAFGGAVVGALLARAFKSRVHLHIQDLVPDVAIESGQLRLGAARAVAGSVARWIYSSFGSVSVLSEGMAGRLHQYRNGTPGAALIAPNWVRNGAGDPALLPRLPRALAGKRYALFAGSFGRKQDLALLVEAAKLLAERQGPVIAILGNGPGRDVVEQSHGQVVWLGLVDEGTYHVVLRGALAGIVALAPGIGDSVLPSKLAGYMGAGRPVVVAADEQSESAQVVNRAGCGVHIPPGRADSLADALCLLSTDDTKWREFAAASEAYAKANWEKAPIVERIETALLALRAGKRVGRATWRPV